MKKTVDIAGTQLELEPELASTAETWRQCLESLRKVLQAYEQQMDEPRLTPALTGASLVPLLGGLVDLLHEHVGWMDAGAPNTRSIAQELTERYADSLLETCSRLLTDWDSLEKLFFWSDLEKHQLVSLQCITPTGSDLHNGGRQVMILTFLLAPTGELPTLSASLTARLVYKPSALDMDWFFVGDTRHLCCQGGPYVYTARPCTHRTCRSLAELLNLELGNGFALPTYVVWPANSATAPRQGDTSPYGYIQYLSHELERDRTAQGEEDVRAFYFAQGRLCALAYVFCMEDMHLQNVLVHSGLPHPIDLENAFANPFRDLSRTLIFREDIGPLLSTLDPTDVTSGQEGTPETLAYRLFRKAGGSNVRLVDPRPYLFQLQQGCDETLRALGKLSEELGERLLNGRNLVARYVLRATSSYKERHGELLAILHRTEDWHDWEKVRELRQEWFEREATDWTLFWFGRVLKAINGKLTQLQGPVPEYCKNVLDEALTGLARSVNVDSWARVTPELLSALSPGEQAPAWERLLEIANLVWGMFEQKSYSAGVEDSWEKLPLFAAVNPEVHEHLRASLPYFTRPIQDTGLFDSSGEEVRLRWVAQPPIPTLTRDEYFPAPIADLVAERLAECGQPGIRAAIVGQIETLMRAWPRR
ncbi:DUF4135 domain-containing protein [Vitiosangium sp. GDMCC 1.1324]|uniref:DUF4135 domain-containing protein n=1 Tax=Vitiosangium sp. (strain GDMCC 1.1324) TaxID=2138576 RepID=UPI000D375AF6|nr:DUF4135 domain-containing protein [Vitiosangium sp. GDMCC 1.1324]PTL83408.1 hypothetical protein DAT35_15650 [Vitiosangium sp. GDMCC 1.1324]